MPFATVRRSLMLFWDVGPIGEVAALVAVLAALLVGPLMGGGNYGDCDAPACCDSLWRGLENLINFGLCDCSS